MSQTWVPQACTLPTEEQPLRIAEFDDLFAGSLLAADRPEALRARLTLAADAEDSARDLAGRETGCCSFFSFAFGHDAAGRVLMDIAVPAERITVLDALVTRAVAASKARS
ncbi:hypothetical protein LO772_27030 [Yinghuangia sp. ASG 101]|uniref:hypothetical protein n=1 Tax=Yinghuangia sp. ASG 101 TaxID=2896848 RepID=UPI001E4B7C93|nr:hypothetical protein [Yinghuangia sp. ASG 101]UGQ10470.1 hypothetical protein LO772_27030 [Yinghuangia sp. ASG 101]